MPLPAGAHPALTLPAEQLAGRIQHALVGPALTDADVRRHAREAVEYSFDAVVVPGCWAGVARDELRGRLRVGAFVDYPHGTMTTAGRVAEVRALVQAGVDELDCTVNLGYLLSGRIADYVADLRALVQAASPIGVKAMLELPMLTPQQRERAVKGAVEAGVAFVQNASRGAVGIADPATISYLRAAVPPSVGVKAAGGIKTIEQVRAALLAGADLIGSTSGVFIVTGERRSKGSLYSY